MYSLKNIRKFYNQSAQLFSTKTGLLSKSFKIYDKEEEHQDIKENPFLISTIRGFLPRTDPVIKPPPHFDILDSLLNRMRWNQPDGSLGLLAKNELGKAVENELPELSIENIKDPMVMMSLYRDYSFLTSAYLLEECHHSFLRTKGDYGLGRNKIPKNLARPFVKIAQSLNMKPFLEYNSGYSLNNWFRTDPTKGIEIK